MPTFKVIDCDDEAEHELNELEKSSIPDTVRVLAVLPPVDGHPVGRLVISHEPVKKSERTRNS
jgi:hypothetical protein